MSFRRTVHHLIVIAAIVFAVLKDSHAKQNIYSFSYAIDVNGVISQQTEDSYNDVIYGYYSFLQPDGKIRVVRYKADAQKGFVAYVKYRRPTTNDHKGHLKFPRDFQHPIWFAQPISSFSGHVPHHKKPFNYNTQLILN